jgi:hypothetical protein
MIKRTIEGHKGRLLCSTHFFSKFYGFPDKQKRCYVYISDFVHSTINNGLPDTLEDYRNLSSPYKLNERFEAFTAMTMKNVVFWDVALCRSCVNRRSSETSVNTRSTQQTTTFFKLNDACFHLNL